MPCEFHQFGTDKSLVQIYVTTYPDYIVISASRHNKLMPEDLDHYNRFSNDILQNMITDGKPVHFEVL